VNDQAKKEPVGSLSTAQRAGGRWRYFVLFGAQTIGALILFWNAVPLYREILASPATYEARTENLTWSVSSILLMQGGYWISDRVRPQPPQLTSSLLGYVILFVARMSFVFSTSVFGFLFIAQKPGFDIPPARYALTIFGLFSLYCYTRELERLGHAFLGRRRNDRPEGFR
jgi:hypothetical protein